MCDKNNNNNQCEKINYIIIDMNDLRQEEMVISYQRGKYIDNEIRWEPIETGYIRYDTNINYKGESGIVLNDCEGYAGFHEPNRTYWKFFDEGTTGKGKYCIRFIQIFRKYCASGICKSKMCHRCYPKLICEDHPECRYKKNLNNKFKNLNREYYPNMNDSNKRLCVKNFF